VSEEAIFSYHFLLGDRDLGVLKEISSTKVDGDFILCNKSCQKPSSTGLRSGSAGLDHSKVDQRFTSDRCDNLLHVGSIEKVVYEDLHGSLSLMPHAPRPSIVSPSSGGVEAWIVLEKIYSHVEQESGNSI
jgi:hypothetical protein